MAAVIPLSAGSSESPCALVPYVTGQACRRIVLRCDIVHSDLRISSFFMNREEGCRNSCMPDQLALMPIIKFFFLLLCCFYMPC